MDKPILVLRDDGQTLGKIEPGEARVPRGRAVASLWGIKKRRRADRQRSAVHRYRGSPTSASPVRVLAEQVRRIAATKADGR